MRSPQLGQEKMVGEVKGQAALASWDGSPTRRNKVLWRGAKRHEGTKVMMKWFLSYLSNGYIWFLLFIFSRCQVTLAHQVITADRYSELIGNLKLLLARVNVSGCPSVAVVQLNGNSLWCARLLLSSLVTRQELDCTKLAGSHFYSLLSVFLQLSHLFLLGTWTLFLL